MVLIIASELDTFAQDAAAQWPGRALLLTLRDLCTRGWWIDLNAFEQSQIVASGGVYPVKDVGGVITLLPYVMDYQLFTIEEAERRYVASELTAFLFYFLSRLECPVLNRPTAHCLVGPSWRPEQWKAACHRAGIPTQALERQQFLQPTPGKLANFSNCVSVIEGTCIGESEVVSHASVVELARLAGVGFLTIRMDGAADEQAIHSIDLIPDLRNSAIREAVHKHFQS